MDVDVVTVAAALLVAVAVTVSGGTRGLCGGGGFGMLSLPVLGTEGPPF